jgi:hypothetical protein
MTLPLPQSFEMLFDLGTVTVCRLDAAIDYAAAVSAADSAGLQKQLHAAKTIIAGQDERSLHCAREHGLLMQRAADVAGERAANAILTAEVERLREVVEGAAAADEFLDSPEAIYRLARLARAALKTAEAALSDIGDADRETGDDLAWCEARAAQALPAVRAALKATP